MNTLPRKMISIALLFCALPAWAEVARIEIQQRETLSAQGTDVRYEAIQGLLHMTLDPTAARNQRIADIGLAPRNSAGLVEYTTDFKLLVPKGEHRSDTLLYYVNNRGGSTLPPEESLQHPLATRGYTFLATGWINELMPGGERMRLHAPIVTENGAPVTGRLRYEVITGSLENDVNIAGSNHLAYAPTARGLREATLTQRVNQQDPRQPVARDDFALHVQPVVDSNQVEVSLSVAGGLQPGVIYELIYEAQDPVLSGAGLAGIRDMVSLLRHGSSDSALSAALSALDVPAIAHTVTWGNSQSGRLLRQYLYQGFNEDLQGQRVFDGIVPVIAGGGFGMFNVRFAMPTRTNGQHENLLYPNDYFPFTYGESIDPFSGRQDGILKQSRDSGTEPRVMHIQTSNEYWLRGGSLAHTNPEGTADAAIPDNVRFYTIGGSQHGSGSGVATTRASSGQLPPNPNRWSPIANSLLVAMVEWVRHDTLPPPSRYPRIDHGTLVPSHLADGQINPAAWHPLVGYRHPKAMYQIAYADYGPRFLEQGIVDLEPLSSTQFYGGRVPAVNADNNDSAVDTVLPPLTSVPLGTFVPWNLRNPVSGADTELARLSGGYIPFARDEAHRAAQDPRPPLLTRYRSRQDYLQRYEQALDALIAAGYLLPDFREEMRVLAEKNASVFD